MQSNNNNNNNYRKMNASSNKQVYKTFCKVCQDSGKSEKEYTNHNVRDARGNTCCPTLLSQECRNCYQRGHTSKYCQMQSRQSVAPREERPVATRPAPVKQEQVKQEQVKQVKNQRQKNVYMCFDSDSDGEDSCNSEKEKEKQYGKTIPAPVLKEDLKTAQKQVLNYGKIIAIAPEIVKKEEVAAYIKETSKVTKIAKIVVAHAPMQAPFRWADCDSDSEGDEEEYEEDNSAW